MRRGVVKPLGRRLSAGVGALVLLFGISACSSGDAAPDPTVSSDGQTSTSTEAPGPEPEQTKDPREIAQEIEAAVAVAEPDLIVAGKLPTPGRSRTFSAELAVLAVEATDSSTRLVFALRNTSGEDETVDPGVFNERTPLMGGVRDVTITDPTAEKVLLPYLAYPDGEDPITTSFCACSDGPLSLVDDWFTLYATLPPLDPATSSVTVAVADFEPVADVPVTRN